MELGPAEFQRHLEELRPRIGRYRFLLALLRFRCRQAGRFPERLHRLLLRFLDARRPYFVGVTADGTKYLGDFRDISSLVWQVEENHDDALLRFLKEGAARRGGAYIDIGANIGVLAASVARSLAGRGEVVAIEAIAETARRAAATFALNGLTNIRLLPVALGEADCEIRMFQTGGHSTWNSAYCWDRLDSASLTESSVPCRALDSLLRQGTICSAGLVKIDVEGHELKVLQGAREFLARLQPAILFEFNRMIAPKAGWKATDASDLIGSAGAYRFQVFHGDGTLTAFPEPSQNEEYINVYCEPPPGRQL